MPLSTYIDTFRGLNRAPFVPSPRTLDKHPHKPLLLLAVLDLVASRYFVDNDIELTPELSRVFDDLWLAALPYGPEPGDIRQPMKHLETNGFWHPTGASQRFVRGRSVHLDDELWQLMQDEKNRAALREALITAHFSPEAAEALRSRSRMSEAALVYARTMLEASVVRESAELPVRSQAFRIAVVRAYDYRCAICGVRIFNEEGRTVVDAAHIVPWSRTQNDTPQNGMALCKLCHWSFDAGMLSVDDNYSVLTSSRLNRDRNHPGILTIVAAREILKPAEPSLWPDKENLAWHRSHTFLR